MEAKGAIARPDYTTRITLANQRALITGASRGLGAEIAAVFADAGADLVITGRDAAGLEATRQVVAKKGRRCLSVAADLRTVEGARIAGPSRDRRHSSFLARLTSSSTMRASFP